MSSLSLFTVAWLACAPASAHELALQALEPAVATSVGEVDQLTHGNPLGMGLMGTEDAYRSYERALSDLFLGDSAAAAERLYALRGMLADDEWVADIEWHLAAALEQEGLHRLRAELLDDITADPSHPYRVDAAEARIEATASAGDPVQLTELRQQLADRGLPIDGTDLRYAVGRAWIRLGQPARAVDELAHVADAPGPLSAKANYLVGASWVQRGGLDTAKTWFLRSIERSDDAALREHATLALARLAYEEGDLATAIEHYQSIPGTSAVLDDALYELAWSFVRQDRLDAAVQTIDLYLLAFGEQQEAGRMAVVRGHLLMQAQRHDEAEDAYVELERQLLPLSGSLEALSVTELAAAARSTSGGSTALPLWVKDHVRSDEPLVAALHLQDDAESLTSDIAEAQQVVADVAQLSDQPVVLRRHRRVRYRVFGALTHVARTLLGAARVELDGRQGRAQRQRARPLRTRADELERALEELEQQASFQAGMVEMEADVERLLDDVEGLLAALKTQRTDDHHDASYQRLDEWVAELVAARHRAESLLDELVIDADSLRAPLLLEVQKHGEALTQSAIERAALSGRASTTWRTAATHRLDALRREIDDALRACMSGAADASWLQMETASTERDALIQRRDEKLERLEALFEVMRARN